MIRGGDERPHQAHQNRPRPRARKVGLEYRSVGVLREVRIAPRGRGLEALKGRKKFVFAQRPSLLVSETTIFRPFSTSNPAAARTRGAMRAWRF